MGFDMQAVLSAPEEGQRVHELAQQGGQAWQLGEHRGFNGQALVGAPEAAGLPVCEGPGDAQLCHESEDVVVLHTPHSQ